VKLLESMYDLKHSNKILKFGGHYSRKFAVSFAQGFVETNGAKWVSERDLNTYKGAGQVNRARSQLLQLMDGMARLHHVNFGISTS